MSKPIQSQPIQFKPVTSRLIRGLFAGAALLAMVVPASAEPKAEVIHWWTSGGESAAVKVFAEAYGKAGGTWIDTAVAGGENARSAAINRVVGGNPPTAMQFNTGKQFDDIVAQGLVNDVETVAARDGWRDFLPKPLLDAVSRDGRIYAIPVNVHGQNWVFTSTKAFEAAGVKPPQSLDELVPALDALKAAGITPIGHGGQPWQDGMMFNAILLAKGGQDLYRSIYADKDGEAVRSEAFRAVVDYYGSLRGYVDPGSPGRHWNDATGMLISGKAGVQFMGDWAKGEFKAAGLTAGEEFGCFVAGPDYMIGGDVFVLAKTDDPDQKAAQELLATTLLSPEAQVDFNLIKGSVPVRPDVDTARFDVCGQTGMERLKDEGRQIGNPEMLSSADLVGSTRDVITEFWNTPDMTTDDFVEGFVEALEIAG
ncbi:ABC transporter substrate-binding protein [Chthonobacter rhizosphaerae]|uniref:ABC transporter substrate-binding protein n=1 Tax=Chthonobacter rhizosphaerae TaxID=2735553 RepID=UPI0015EEFF85|nr:ABC transporter substrate-binding protein [Chthonobacter rhizosphaerae]